MEKVAVIVAGGSGKRMGKQMPKQFIELAGKPLLMHTINLFYEFDNTTEIIVVLPEPQIDMWKNLCEKHAFLTRHSICQGGETRFHSVKNGLSEVKGNKIVFIHDGVRPLVSQSTLEDCFKVAAKKGNAIPAMPATESIRKVEGSKNMAVERSKYFLVQTPQTFHLEEIKKAYNQEYSLKFTDDASVFEANNNTIYLVEGNRENIKITFPQDLQFAELIFLSQKTIL